MKVKDLMSKNVAAVSPDTSLEEVARMMKEMNIGSVPVCNSGRVVGIVTDRDIIVRELAMGKNPVTTRVEDVMTYGISTASPDMDIHDAAQLMSDKQVRRLPVVENERLVGMIAIGDMAVRSKLEDDAGEALSDISKPSHTIY
jgi:CBS domain-containing protein